MAKALYGHLGAHDSRLTWENDRLRARVAELESEVTRLSLELAEVSDAILSRVALGDPVPEVDPLLLRPALA